MVMLPLRAQSICVDTLRFNSTVAALSIAVANGVIGTFAYFSARLLDLLCAPFPLIPGGLRLPDGTLELRVCYRDDSSEASLSLAVRIVDGEKAWLSTIGNGWCQFAELGGVADNAPINLEIAFNDEWRTARTVIAPLTSAVVSRLDPPIISPAPGRSVGPVSVSVKTAAGGKTSVMWYICLHTFWLGWGCSVVTAYDPTVLPCSCWGDVLFFRHWKYYAGCRSRTRARCCGAPHSMRHQLCCCDVVSGFLPDVLPGGVCL